MAQYQGTQFGNFDLGQIISLAQRSKEQEMQKEQMEKQGKLQDLMMEEKDQQIQDDRSARLLPEAMRAANEGHPEMLQALQDANPNAVNQWKMQQQAQQKAGLENTNLQSQISGRDVETQGKAVKQFQETQLNTAKSIDSAVKAITKDPNQAQFQVARLQNEAKSGAISLQGVQLPQNADPQAWGQLGQHASQTISMMTKPEFSPLIIEAMNKNGISDPNQAMADKQTMIDFGTAWKAKVIGQEKGQGNVTVNNSINPDSGNSMLETRARNALQLKATALKTSLAKVPELQKMIDNGVLEDSTFIGHLGNMISGIAEKIDPSSTNDQQKQSISQARKFDQMLRSLTHAGSSDPEEIKQTEESVKNILTSGSPTQVKAGLEELIRSKVEEYNTSVDTIKNGIVLEPMQVPNFDKNRKETQPQQTQPQPVAIDPVNHLQDRLKAIDLIPNIGDKEKEQLRKTIKQQAKQPKQKQAPVQNEPDVGQGDETSMVAPLQEKDKYAALVDAIKKGKVDPSNPDVQQELNRLKQIGAAS
jgi:hypothetical protein